MNDHGLRLRAGLFLFATLLTALFGAWLMFGQGRSPIQTDLLAMLPTTEQNPLAEEATQRLAHANGDRMVLLVQNADDGKAKAAALALGYALQKNNVFANVTAELPPFDLQQLSAPYLAHRFMLLTDDDRAALTRPGYNVQAVLAQRLNEPFSTGVGLRLQDDPFGWLQHWLDQQPWSRSALVPEDNLLTAHRDNQTYVLVMATLAGSSFDNDVQERALAALHDAEQSIGTQFAGTKILRTGAIFYASAARAGAEHDVHLISWVSSIGIALLLIGMFRSPRPLLLAFLSTAVGVIVATTLSVLVFGQIYLLTLVFGAALLGEAVDYSIQYLSARANQGATWQPMAGLRQVRPALLLALSTSLLGYALLAFVPFPALRQMACFAMAGMAAACLSVFWLLPVLLQKPAKPLAPAPVRWSLALQKTITAMSAGNRACWLCLALLALSIPGWTQLRHDDDVHLLITQPKALATEEATIRDITGLGDATQFFLIQGSNEEITLQHEEALETRLQSLVDTGHLQGWLGVAGMVPSLQRQQLNHAALSALFAQPQLLQQSLVKAGFRDSDITPWMDAWPGTPLTLGSWLSTPLSTPFRYLWMGPDAHGFASVVMPQGKLDVALLAQATHGLDGVTLVDKPAGVSNLFGRYRSYASVWLLAAILLIVPVFGWRYGFKQAPRVLAPPVVGIALTLAALGYLQQPLTLFHWMALMLVLGVGANYAVFLREGEPHAVHRPGAMYASVLLSAITALLSFGLLALSSMPALRDFGLTLLLGIAFTVLLVPASTSNGKLRG